MANMLVELKSDESKDSPKDSEKDMPMSHGSSSDAESMKKSGSKKSKKDGVAKIEEMAKPDETMSQKAESKNKGKPEDASNDNMSEEIK